MNRLGAFLSPTGQTPAAPRRRVSSDSRSPVDILIEQLARLTPAEASARKPGGLRCVGRSLGFALDGWRAAWTSEQNLRLHVYAGLTITVVGVCARLSAREWLWISLAIGLVVMTELANTALESVIDLVVGPQRHPLVNSLGPIPVVGAVRRSDPGSGGDRHSGRDRKSVV